MTATGRAIGTLRAATDTLHRRLEVDAQIVARLKSPDERAAVVAGYRTMMHQAAEALEPWLAGIPGLQRSNPARSDPRPAVGVTRPVLADRAEALGFHYVIAGSALGGRIILRELERDGVDTCGLDFLNPHGAQTGTIWRNLQRVLERHLASDAEALERAVAGARKAYAFARLCLAPATAAAAAA